MDRRQGGIKTSLDLPQYREHSRIYRENRFVYPVLSRRSRGLSIGINLNPDKICNFDCVYCQVNRRVEAVARFVESERLLAELDAMLALVVSGEIFETERFRETPQPLRRLNDIAFSGDGEPTTYRDFDRIVADVAKTKRDRAPDDVKIVLITNASMFHRPDVQRGLKVLDENNGEVWAKLETGTEEYYRRVARSRIPFRRILENIRDTARRRPIVIQSLFSRIEDEAPSKHEIEELCKRLNEILDSGGQIKFVQVHTVARPPAERWVESLTDEELAVIAATVTEQTGLQTEVYSG